MTRNLDRTTPLNYVAANQQGIRNEERKPNLASFWVCVGTYVGDGDPGNDPACTTPSSPPYENSWTYDGTDYVMFRHGLDGLLEFQGLPTGGAAGTVMTTLPAEWRPAQDTAYYHDAIIGAVRTGARWLVDASTGEVTIEELGGSTGGSTTPVIDLRNPTVGAYFVPKGFTGLTIGTWFLKNGLDSQIVGAAVAPDSFSEIAVNLSLLSSSGTGNVVVGVSTQALGAGDSPGGTLSAESNQTIAVGGSIVIGRFPTAGGLASNPQPGDLIPVVISRLGTSGSDTLANPLLLLVAWLDVT